MKTLAIVQARLGSKRFPKKVLSEIKGKSIIEILLSRLSQSKEIDKIVVATTSKKEDLELVSLVSRLGYEYFCGSENDVLDRFYRASKKFKGEIIVRITGDCPLIDHEIVDKCVSEFKNSEIDFLSNNFPPTFPDGLDVEVFSFKSLEMAKEKAISKDDLEHVTPYFKNNEIFKKLSIKNKHDHSSLRWTLDEKEDLEVINNIINSFYPKINFKFNDILKLYKRNPDLFEANRFLFRNEGSKMKDNKKLWKRAKKVIPGGNMLLSKRPNMFHENSWPTYYKKAKGCEIWDLNGDKFIDIALMGVGTNILGYANPQIDRQVKKAISDSNLTSLNAFEEVLLAEKLVEMHSWANMVRFARTGGEANSIAVRIARAASGKDNIAVCGYHGWHDWYLASNLENKDKLEGHLLPGLEIKGVPKSLKGTVHTFTYNNFDELSKIVMEKNIGVIKMEVQRNKEPEDNFLQKVRELADLNNIVLIFDECTTGFRETFGGLHKKFNVSPDIAIFGKALGNGYAITAILGKKEIMESAQSSFISSTFWTERIGSVAALECLEIMEQTKSWEIITEIGKKIKNKWNTLKNKENAQFEITGINSLCSFVFKDHNLIKKTFITQEMLKKGFLATNSVYSCVEHKEEILKLYFENFELLIEEISNSSILELENKLEGEVCDSGFKRLN